jgi:hypothetical protein
MLDVYGAINVGDRYANPPELSPIQLDFLSWPMTVADDHERLERTRWKLGSRAGHRFHGDRSGSLHSEQQYRLVPNIEKAVSWSRPTKFFVDLVT